MWISYLCDHFTTFTRSYLAEDLKDQNFCHLPGEVSDIPVGEKELRFFQNITISPKKPISRVNIELWLIELWLIKVYVIGMFLYYCSMFNVVYLYLIIQVEKKGRKKVTKLSE